MSGTIAELVADAAQRDPDRTALVDATSGASISWRALDREVTELAAASRLVPGERVLIAASSSLPTCVWIYAVLRAGGVVVPVAPDAPEQAIEQVRADSGARFGVGVAGLPTPDTANDTAPAAADPAAAAGTGEGERMALLCYTSGTTARPRGVMLSHRAVLANAAQCAAIRPTPIAATDRVLLALPLHHIYGLSAGLFQAASVGATAVLVDEFHPAQVLDTIVGQRVTSFLGVPQMYSALLSLGSERLAEGLAGIRMLTSGAAPLGDGVLAAMRAATGLWVYEGYGLTEAAPVVTSTLMSNVIKAGSVGGAVPGVEIKLVDSDGAELPGADEAGDDTRGTGRIAVRGRNLFSGYWPDGAHGPDADGWLVTGDIGFLDVDGDLHLVDRADDLIIVNGFNVYPHEVEEVLSTMDGVREAAAVGVLDERTGEAVKAVLVLRDGADVSADQVREYCAARLARFKAPAVVEFVAELPYSTTGKVFRRKLRP
jgi:long-chain acyl-CoA synthetase